MPVELFISLCLFALLMVGTPGPANLVIMSAGARFGVAKSLPFIGGIIIGKLLLNVALAVGVLALLSSHPWIAVGMRAISTAYVLFLAWRIANMRMSDKNTITQLPGFVAGLPVHPLNPKAWAMLTTAYAQFTMPGESWLTQTLTVCAVFFIIQCVIHPIWCWAGVRLAALVGGGIGERVLMIGLALSTVIVVLWALLQRG